MERIGVEREEGSVQIPISYSDPAILVPKIGQTFEEDSDGYAFYNLYARFYGFEIRRSKVRFKDSGMKSMQEFCCIRQGRDKSVTGHRTRIGCKAMLRINRLSEGHNWRVSAFEEDAEEHDAYNVMVQYGFTEIPKKYIMKRWTKDARDSIPKHLEEYYLKDKEAAVSRTYRNTLLHKCKLDLVKLGGTSAERYE
ncbi:hypothetical protein E2562_020393 [Oryza meyeriana var. granulata]|uniref:FAR1 domain-containing protein n=1 Tax=Oryza meyeriana var. granulata TaxID=110450 RepID=A0A6G1DLD0_9ORYZ|nr:hypothetical protein E2562_020393 [Oryza meyeriana var. granulata]